MSKVRTDTWLEGSSLTSSRCPSSRGVTMRRKGEGEHRGIALRWREATVKSRSLSKSICSYHCEDVRWPFARARDIPDLLSSRPEKTEIILVYITPFLFVCSTIKENPTFSFFLFSFSYLLLSFLSIFPFTLSIAYSLM